jgi:glycosyltransferase involved in cell wall biosynthesis
MDPKIGKISVIMPAYNEEAHIYENVVETRKVFEESGVPYEIIVSNDGSKDKTFENAQKAERDFPNVFAVNNPINLGKGQALREGYTKVTGDYVVFLDSDLDLHPNQIHLLFDIMQKENTDIVIGSKRHPQSKVLYPTDRKIISNGYFFLIKIMFGLPIKDTQTGLKLYKREVLDRVFPRILVKRFAFDLEMLAVAHHFGYKISEAPVVVTHRWKFGRIGFRPILETWWDTMAVFYRMRILGYYDKG